MNKHKARVTVRFAFDVNADNMDAFLFAIERLRQHTIDAMRLNCKQDMDDDWEYNLLGIFGMDIKQDC